MMMASLPSARKRRSLVLQNFHTCIYPGERKGYTEIEMPCDYPVLFSFKYNKSDSRPYSMCGVGRAESGLLDQWPLASSKCWRWPHHEGKKWRWVGWRKEDKEGDLEDEEWCRPITDSVHLHADLLHWSPPTWIINHFDVYCVVVLVAVPSTSHYVFFYFHIFLWHAWTDI